MMEIIISSSILIAIIILLRYFLKGKINLRLQYGLWALVAIRLLFPFNVAASSLSVLNIFEMPSLQGLVQSDPISEAPVYSFNNPLPTSPIQRPAIEAIDTDASDIYIGADSPSAVNSPLAIIWLLGAVAMALMLVVSNLRFYLSLRERAVPIRVANCPLPVYLAEGLPSPCLYGIFRPAIYLNTGDLKGENRLNHIILHELTHYRHKDHIWALVRSLCLVLHWFNPLVWAGAILSKRDCELACDEGTLLRLGEEDRLEYGRTLISMISANNSPRNLLNCATTMSCGRSEIKERISLIAKKPRMLIITLVAVILVSSITAACTFTGVKDNNEEAPPPLEESTTYSIFKLGMGGQELASKIELTTEEAKLVKELIFDYMVKSAAWPGEDMTAVEEYYLIQAAYPNSTEVSELYAYMLDGRSVMQGGKDGFYSIVSGMHYANLEKILTGEASTPATLADRLEPYISEAIISHNIDSYRSGEFQTESHVLLKIEEDDTTVTAYLMGYYAVYNFPDGKPQLAGGGYMPMALVFSKRAAGGFSLVDYWRASDGSDYATSIRARFPSDIAAAAMDSQKYAKQQVEACDLKAEEYLKSRRSEEELIRRIADGPSSASNPYAYIELHQKEYAMLVSRGDTSLRYIYRKFLEGKQEGLEGWIMLLVCRDILGNEDKPAEAGSSPQAIFDEYAADVIRKGNELPMEELMKYDPGAFLLLEMMEEM